MFWKKIVKDNGQKKLLSISTQANPNQQELENMITQTGNANQTQVQESGNNKEKVNSWIKWFEK